MSSNPPFKKSSQPLLSPIKSKSKDEPINIFNEAINKNLKVMDQTSLCFCRDYGLNVRVFDANKKNTWSIS